MVVLLLCIYLYIWRKQQLQNKQVTSEQAAEQNSIMHLVEENKIDIIGIAENSTNIDFVAHTYSILVKDDTEFSNEKNI